MRDRMRADRHQRIVRECLQFLPGHAELAGDRGLVHVIARAERGDLALQVVLARQRAQPVVHPVEGRLLRRRCRGVEAGRDAADRDFDRGGLAIARSSATHHNRPVPSAKSLVT